MCNTQEKQEKHQAPQGKAAFLRKRQKPKIKGNLQTNGRKRGRTPGKGRKREKKATPEPIRAERSERQTDPGRVAPVQQGTPIRSGHGTHFQGGRTGKQAPKQRGGADAEKGAGHKEHFAGVGNAKRCGAARVNKVFVCAIISRPIQGRGAEQEPPTI